MGKTINQKGFSAVEAVLVLVIIIAIAGVGWFVWHSKQMADKTLTSNSSSNPVFKKDVKSKGTATKTTSSPTPSTTPTNYFTISQWGIRAPYSGSLTLEYQQNSSNSGDMMLSSSQLNAGGPSICTTADGAAGYITRYLPTDDVAQGETAQQYLSQNFAASNSKAPAYAKIGNYYYIYSNGQADGCNNATLYHQTEDAFSVLVPKLQATQ